MQIEQSDEEKIWFKYFGLKTTGCIRMDSLSFVVVDGSPRTIFKLILLAGTDFNHE